MTFEDFLSEPALVHIATDTLLALYQAGLSIVEAIEVVSGVRT